MMQVQMEQFVAIFPENLFLHTLTQIQLFHDRELLCGRSDWSICPEEDMITAKDLNGLLCGGGRERHSKLGIYICFDI